mmetsp:Transcript_14419/g.29835  ORF Transcript_14419/g.29835 Transcript_14419/m.29835 type:complete len:483 (+) Transcript_14419:2927-4375(+)
MSSLNTWYALITTIVTLVSGVLLVQHPVDRLLNGSSDANTTMKNISVSNTLMTAKRQSTPNTTGKVLNISAQSLSTPEHVSDKVDANKKIEKLSLSSEPLMNRWGQRFGPFENDNATISNSGYLFFKHMRKAGGTTMRSYLHSVLTYHNDQKGPKASSRSLAGSSPTTGNKRIAYYEQEFRAMDWRCPKDDPRWQDSVKITVLRHPVERHISEFFFSGPGKDFRINRAQLQTDAAYAKEIGKFFRKQMTPWLLGDEYNDRLQDEVKRSVDGQKHREHWFFNRFYVDNYQIRALAGCTKDCKKKSKSWTSGKKYPYEPNILYSGSPIYQCTQIFQSAQGKSLNATCRHANGREACPHGCDGPCNYDAAAWGKVGQLELDRAKSALESFDLVMITETMDQEDQARMVSNVMGVPFSFADTGAQERITNVKKSTREKTHYYRDMLAQTSNKTLDLLVEMNRLELELYDHAVLLNGLMTEKWKLEK